MVCITFRAWHATDSYVEFKEASLLWSTFSFAVLVVVEPSISRYARESWITEFFSICACQPLGRSRGYFPAKTAFFFAAASMASGSFATLSFSSSKVCSCAFCRQRKTLHSYHSLCCDQRLVGVVRLYCGFVAFARYQCCLFDDSHRYLEASKPVFSAKQQRQRAARDWLAQFVAPERDLQKLLLSSTADRATRRLGAAWPQHHSAQRPLLLQQTPAEWSGLPPCLYPHRNGSSRPFGPHANNEVSWKKAVFR